MEEEYKISNRFFSFRHFISFLWLLVLSLISRKFTRKVIPFFIKKRRKITKTTCLFSSGNSLDDFFTSSWIFFPHAHILYSLSSMIRKEEDGGIIFSSVAKKEIKCLSHCGFTSFFIFFYFLSSPFPLLWCVICAKSSHKKSVHDKQPISMK